MRQMWGEGNWLNWQRIDNYGTTSLAGLATALGVPNQINGQAIDASDLNVDSLWKCGLYDITGSIGNPYSGAGHTAFMIVINNSTYALQMAYRNGEPNKSRWYWTNGWTDWT